MGYDWKELTQRNIDTIQEIFTRSAPRPTRAERLVIARLAYDMIRDDRFETVSAKWNAFHNALRILSEGLFQEARR